VKTPVLTGVKSFINKIPQAIFVQHIGFLPMKKFLLSVVVVLLVQYTSFGQTSTIVTQQVDVNLVNVISMKFVSTNGTSGTTLNLAMNLLTDLLSGVATSAQQLTVSSTKNFNITAKTNSAFFTYTGSSLLGNLMPILGNLRCKVAANGTGGAIAGAFANYTSLSSSAQNFINGGTSGTNKTFSVQYQGIPGLGFALGTYSTQVVFTGTQQ